MHRGALTLSAGTVVTAGEISGLREKFYPRAAGLDLLPIAFQSIELSDLQRERLFLALRCKAVVDSAGGGNTFRALLGDVRARERSSFEGRWS